MIKLALIILSLLALSVSSFSHTYKSVEVKCPVDGTEFKTDVTQSMSVFGQYRDFQSRGAIGFYYESIFHSCPKCHYSGSINDFRLEINDELKKKVLSQIKTQSYPKKGALKEAIECEWAAIIANWRGIKSFTIGNYYLIASYILRPSNEKEKRIFYQKKAIEYFEKSIEKKEIGKKEFTAVYYLLGELHRRTSQFDQAIKYYDKALESQPDANLKKWIVEQKSMAEKKDDNNVI